MSYIIALNLRGRGVAQGKFLWSKKHGKAVWKREEYGTIETLVPAVNEAVKYLNLVDDSVLLMTVEEVREEVGSQNEEGGSEEAAPAPPIDSNKPAPVAVAPKRLPLRKPPTPQVQPEFTDQP
jgi:hypothetical protein